MELQRAHEGRRSQVAAAAVRRKEVTTELGGHPQVNSNPLDAVVEEIEATPDSEAGLALRQALSKAGQIVPGARCVAPCIQAGLLRVAAMNEQAQVHYLSRQRQQPATLAFDQRLDGAVQV
ncbi:MAG: hypothetical protein C4289_15620, partial [Chloroflexota bacterium]